MNIFAKAWKGEASLAVAFWIIYVLFGILIGIIIALIFMMVVPDFNYAQHHAKIVAIGFPYTLYSAICVWRCGKNSIFIWRLLSRIVVVIAIIGGVLNIIDVISGRPTTLPGVQTETTTVTVENRT